jgi:hypothetical protein
VRDSVIIAFAVAVLAIFFTNAISEAYAKGDYTFIAALLLGALFLITAWAALVLMTEVRNLRRNLGLAGIPGCQFRMSDKLTLASVLNEAPNEVCFLGITGNRSFNDDQFKRFLESQHAGTGIRLRVLLLNPNSKAFSRRAAEEKAPVNSWKLELEATIHRLRLYREEYRVNIEVRYYDVFPVLRLIIVDKRKIVINFFLDGRRGTDSSQLSFDDSPSDLANFFVKWFNVIWDYHSQETDLEKVASKE